MLGISGARVMSGDFPVSRADQAFDASGQLADPFVAERLRDHVAALAFGRRPSCNRGLRVSKPTKGRARRPFVVNITVTSVEVVEALPGTVPLTRSPCGASREPPTLARRFPVVPGARLYPLVPPLPVLSSLKAGPPPFRGIRSIRTSSGWTRAKPALVL